MNGPTHRGHRDGDHGTITLFAEPGVDHASDAALELCEPGERVTLTATNDQSVWMADFIPAVRPMHTLQTIPAHRVIQEDFRIAETERIGARGRREWTTLRVMTRHDQHHHRFASGLRCIVLTELGGFTAPLVVRDPAPAPRTARPTNRYSLAALRDAHDSYVAAHLDSTEQLAAALDWARTALEHR